MGIINAECGKTFRIAYQGENKRQQVRFDLADIMGEFPGGTAVLAVLRNGDADPVPAAETAMDGTALIWTVTAWECALDGFLYAQVTYAAGETVAKTKVYRFDVKNSLVVNGAEPEGWQDLVGQLVTAADGVNSAISAAMDTLDEKVTAAEAAQDAAEDAQEAAETARDEAVAAVGQYDAMTAEATGLAAGDEPTAVIDHTGDHPVLQLGIPKGEKGDTGATGQAGPAGPSGVDGFSPTAGVSKVGKIATITIVDKNGTTTASVSDGADGDPGDIIDDTAGAGDTDKTFSADKLTAMDSELKNAISVLEPAATSSDVGKFLKAKTVSGGKVTEYEFGEGGGSGGTDDYSDLSNKPQINGVTLAGNKSASDLGLLSGQGVTEAVDDYLEENFSNPSNPPLDRTLSSELSAAPADVVGDALDLLLENKTTKDYVAEANVVDTVKEIDANGDIVASQFTNLKIWGFAIDGNYTGVGFNVVNGNAKYIAFYNAANYSQCSSSTFISKVQYTSSADNEVPFPSGATYCLINYRAFNSGYLYLNGTVTTAHEELEEFSQELNTQIGDKMSFADLATFSRGKVNSNGAIDSSVQYRCVNQTILNITRTITFNFDTTTYHVTVYYYDENGNVVNNNGSLTTFDARTILKGSYVRLVIYKNNSTVKLTDAELISLPKAITFATEAKEWEETVDDNCGYESLCAKMFEKGNSPKEFSNALGIIVAGQSNIDGRVPKVNLPASIEPPFENIKNNINLTNGVFSSSMSLPTNFGIDFSMYAALNDLAEPVYVIKRSQGDTSISPYGNGSKHWTPFYEELDNISNSLLYTFEAQIRKCIADNPNTFDIRALVWQQGEGDYATDTSGSKKASVNYYKNFKCLVAYVRGIVGNERLPVVCGTVSHLSGQYDPRVEEATLKVAQEDPYMICIDMSGATLLDSYHFDADSAVYFGYKAFDALIDLGVITGTKINPVCPWEDED